jgi:hypothetical protein
MEPILRRIKQSTHQSRSNLKECFTDFDRFKNGTVPIAKLATALTNTGLFFSKSEINILARQFADSKRPEFVNYFDLCTTVMSICEDADGFGNVPMTSEEESDAVAVVRRWTDAILRKRWTFRRLFAGSPIGLMKADVFREKVVGAGLLLRTDEWLLLQRKYHGNPAGDLDWARFVDDSEKRSPF